MKFIVLTLFPQMIEAFISSSIIGRAIKDKKIDVELHNLRDWATDRHKTVDDTPYGGGAGMVLRVDIIDRALYDLKTNNPKSEVILLTPQGKTLGQQLVEELVDSSRTLILVAGHYEGFDERVRLLVDREVSIGNYVLTGGELPAAVIIDAVSRLVAGVLGDKISAQDDSFSLKDDQGRRLLEYPQYTRPVKFKSQSKPELEELAVPEILQAGDHGRIQSWRLEQAKLRTHQRLTND